MPSSKQYAQRAKALRKLFRLPFNQRTRFSPQQKATITRLWNQNSQVISSIQSGSGVVINRGSVRGSDRQKAVMKQSGMNAFGGAQPKVLVIKTERVDPKAGTKRSLRSTPYDIEYRTDRNGELRAVIKEPWGSVDRVELDIDGLLIDSMAEIESAASEMDEPDIDSGDRYFITVYGKLCYNFPFFDLESVADELESWFAQYNARWSNDIETGAMELGLAVFDVDQTSIGMNATLGL